MEKEIKIRIKNVYGTDLAYPANDAAEVFVGLIGAKTFQPWHLTEIRDELGYKVTVETPDWK